MQSSCGTEDGHKIFTISIKDLLHVEFYMYPDQTPFFEVKHASWSTYCFIKKKWNGLNGFGWQFQIAH